jgi:hypothetical protein
LHGKRDRSAQNPFTFSVREVVSQRAILSRQFRENSPYPHLHLQRILDPDVAPMATEFPVCKPMPDPI